MSERERELRQALESLRQAYIDVLEALKNPDAPYCNQFTSRAFTQINHAAKNLARSNTCARLPPEGQRLYAQRYRRRDYSGSPGSP